MYQLQNDSSLNISELTAPNFNAARNAAAIENFIVKTASDFVGCVFDLFDYYLVVNPASLIRLRS